MHAIGAGQGAITKDNHKYSTIPLQKANWQTNYLRGRKPIDEIGRKSGC